MNADNFAEYLKNPAQLYQLSYQELKSLVLEYPYCQNLHVLLLIKSRLDQRNIEAPLAKAATYSMDRNFLYKQLQLAPEQIERDHSLQLHEEVLELKDLNALHEPVVPEEAVSEENEMHLTEAPAPSIPDAAPSFDDSPVLFAGIEDEQENMPNAADPIEELPDLAETIGTISPPKAKESQAVITEETMDTLANRLAAGFRILSSFFDASIEGESLKAPLPKKSFSSYSKPKIGMVPTFLNESPSEAKPKKKKKKKIDPIVAFAEKSLTDSPDIASETLARLLVDQGLLDKAIEIYQRLMEIFPDKQEEYEGFIKELQENRE